VHGDPDGEYDDPDDDLDQDPPDIDIDIDFGGDEDEGGEVTAANAKRMLCEQLDKWLTSGKTEFSPRDLYPLINKLGRGRRWFYHLRDDLRDEGVIADGDDVGSYEIIRSSLAGAGTEGGH
jgi:hypothetical protein